MKNAISDISPISPDEMETFFAHWKPLMTPKGHILLAEGEIAHHIYFIGSGGMRSFFTKDGKQITEWLGLEKTFMFSPVSLFLQKSGRLTFQTIEPSLIYSIDIAELEQLCDASHQIAQFYRRLLEKTMLAAEQRIESLLTGSAVERYQHLATQYPDIIQRVPLSYIASYIGITKETLSRVRGMKELA